MSQEELFWPLVSPKYKICRVPCRRRTFSSSPLEAAVVSVVGRHEATGPRYKIDHLESSKSFRQSLLVAANTTTTKPRRRSSGLGHIISICRGTHRPVAGSYVTSANMLQTQHSEMSERCCPRRRLLVWWMDGWGDYIGDR